LDIQQPSGDVREPNWTGGLSYSGDGRNQIHGTQRRSVLGMDHVRWR